MHVNARIFLTRRVDVDVPVPVVSGDQVRGPTQERDVPAVGLMAGE